mmetsp:Transcript_8986/g.19095  ORF Transcript_8986/g.19095 Transcript_8986/m.19095 type:complete len:505 (+) Transcript_8986:248-1762(+)
MMHDILLDTNNIVPVPTPPATTEEDFEPHQYNHQYRQNHSHPSLQHQQQQQQQQQHQRQQLGTSTSACNLFGSEIDVEDVVDCFTNTEALELYEQFAFGDPTVANPVPSSSGGLDEHQQQNQQRLEPLPLAVPSSLPSALFSSSLPASAPATVPAVTLSDSGGRCQFDSVFDNTPPVAFNNKSSSRGLPRSTSLISVSPSPTTDPLTNSSSAAFAATTTAGISIVTPETITSYVKPGVIVSDIDNFAMDDMPPLPEAEGSVSAAAAAIATIKVNKATPSAIRKSPSSKGGGKLGGRRSGSAKTSADTTTAQRFKPFHEEKWDQRLSELLHFRKKYGHTLVPHTFDPNPQLARWVKRQRRQYKLLQSGKTSTMTADRVVILEDAGFVWDSHEVSWREKVQELMAYRERYGNCLVPSSYRENPQLATWVKCQRRQYKLYGEGKPSGMNPRRIEELEAIDFCWEIRPDTKPSVATTSSPGKSKGVGSKKKSKRNASLDLLGKAAAML